MCFKSPFVICFKYYLVNSITFKLHRFLYTHENDFRIQFNTLVLTYHIALFKVYMRGKNCYICSCIFPMQHLNSAKNLFFYILDCLKALYSICTAYTGAVSVQSSGHSSGAAGPDRLLSYMNYSVRASKISTTLRVFHTPPNIFCKTVFI